MRFSSKKLLTGLAAAVIATACLGFGSVHKSNERATNVTLVSATKFNNGATLPAGTYRMEIPEGSLTPSVAFYKDGKVVATVNGKVVNETKKNANTEIDSVSEGNDQLVTAIRPSGWHERIVFGGNSQ